MEVIVRDADGRVHVLPAGNTKFNGWKNIIVSVPGWINQHSRLRSGPENMSFVGFRVRTDASEYVDDFIMWGYYDGHGIKKNAPMFDIDWNKKLAADQLIDIIYNKIMLADIRWVNGDRSMCEKLVECFRKVMQEYGK